VILADDHEATLDRIARLLEPKFEIVGTAGDGATLLNAVEKLDPDLVILDISMPIMNGIDAARQLQYTGSRAKIVFLTIHDEQDYVRACLEAGALGYVVKPRLATDLLVAVDEALAGRRFVSDRWDVHEDGLRGR
jgi:DNA-binding NarL/FixJ family response regulator